MYCVGDYIVKTTNGVCEIKNILNPDFVSDSKKMYYQLRPLADANAKLFVPVDKEDGTLRAVMTETQAEELVRKIPSINEIWVNNEKERERRYKEAIQSNNPEKLVGIIKLIYQRKQSRMRQGKKTTAVDGRYFDIAEKLLYSELEFVMKKNRDEIYEMISESCNQN